LAVDHRIVGGSIGTGVLSGRLGLNASFIDAGVVPELTGSLDWVSACLLPPRFFVTGAMYRAVMRAAERDRKFIARFPAKRARLYKSDMMRIGGLAAAQQAGLLHHKAKVVPVAIATRRRHREYALVDADLISTTCIDLPNLVTNSAETLRGIGVYDFSAFGPREFA
jgi:hypothetical protein